MLSICIFFFFFCTLCAVFFRTAFAWTQKRQMICPLSRMRGALELCAQCPAGEELQSWGCCPRSWILNWCYTLLNSNSHPILCVAFWGWEGRVYSWQFPSLETGLDLMAAAASPRTKWGLKSQMNCCGKCPFLSHHVPWQWWHPSGSSWWCFAPFISGFQRILQRWWITPRVKGMNDKSH